MIVTRSIAVSEVRASARATLVTGPPSRSGFWHARLWRALMATKT